MDNKCGGATDVTHDFGFGQNIGSLVLPRPEVGLSLCVRHFLDGGANISGIATFQEFTFFSDPDIMRTSVVGCDWGGKVK